MDISFITSIFGDKNVQLTMRRSEECIRKRNELSKYIESLQLDDKANNKLIELILAQVLEAEKGAFKDGVDLGFILAERIIRGM